MLINMKVYRKKSEYCFSMREYPYEAQNFNLLNLIVRGIICN